MSEKKLVRSTTDKMVAGVCGGLAQYLEVDTVIIRIAFVVFALLGGPGIIVYIILWIVMPEGPVGMPTATGEDGSGGAAAG
jgi:phage shock protein PspC (stress-responsive transcriptional regulator)